MSLAKLHRFNSQNISSTVWAFARMTVIDLPFMLAVTQNAAEVLSDWPTQELVNTAWAFSKLSLWHQAFWKAFGATVADSLHSFSPQDLATVAWGCAAVVHKGAPLLQVLVPASMQRCP